MMARVVFPLALAGAFAAPGYAFVLRPLSTVSTIVSDRRASTPQHRYTSHRSLRLSTVALPGSNVAGAVAVAPATDASPSVKAPPDMYQNAVNIGEKKCRMPAAKTFLLGIISGCHIAFGALLAITVGGNCPGLATSNPGLQKILFGAFGR